MEIPDAAELHCQASPGFAQTPRSGMVLTAVSRASGSSSLPSWQRANHVLQPVILA